MQIRHKPYGPYEAVIKPILDRMLALIFVLLFWWLYIILAILVRVKLGTPVIFAQNRPGKRDKRTGEERIFKLYKFRSMTDEKDDKGKLLPDEARLTGFGKKLRSTSLDEIPEILFNILIFHNMSWIGPRPLLVRYLSRYTAEQHCRHDVLPGLTGYAQVHGRNAVSWEEKFAMDVEYVNHVTFLGDVKILIDTIKTVLKREGVNSENSATVEEFMGGEHEETEVVVD